VVKVLIITILSVIGYHFLAWLHQFRDSRSVMGRKCPKVCQQWPHPGNCLLLQRYHWSELRCLGRSYAGTGEGPRSVGQGSPMDAARYGGASGGAGGVTEVVRGGGG